jgi:hypothetical protein
MSMSRSLLAVRDLQRGNQMKRVLISVAVLVFVLPLTGSAQTEKKTDLTGKWLFSVTTDAGTGTPTVTLKQSGDTLSGHYSSQAFCEVDFKNGSVKGKNVTFKFSADVGGTPLVVTYTGTIEADGSLKGSVDLGGYGTGTFTAKRE